MNIPSKILVIDDDPDIGTMINMVLTYKGYDVSLVDSAGDAMEYLAKRKVDLIVMDMLLSGANGVDICTVIKANAALTNIPVIMMSAHPDAQNVCLQAGANDFIFKPFDMKDILSKVGYLLSIRSAA